nr:hypothetical protein [Legionella longbeachae]
MNSVQNRKLNFFISFWFSLVAMSLAGCVDLSGGRASVKKPIPKASSQVALDKSTKHNAKNTVKLGASQPYKGEVHTMLGGWDCLVQE